MKKLIIIAERVSKKLKRIFQHSSSIFRWKVVLLRELNLLLWWHLVTQAFSCKSVLKLTNWNNIARYYMSQLFNLSSFEKMASIGWSPKMYVENFIYLPFVFQKYNFRFSFTKKCCENTYDEFGIISEKFFATQWKIDYWRSEKLLIEPIHFLCLLKYGQQKILLF